MSLKRVVIVSCCACKCGPTTLGVSVAIREIEVVL